MFLKNYRHVIIIFFFGLLLFRRSRASSFIYASCSQGKYDPITPFQAHLTSLLASLVAGAPLALYNSYSVGDNSTLPPGLAAFGLFQCRSDLPPGDCAACVRDAVEQLALDCPRSFAGSLQLASCFVRYSNENFLGKPDASLVFRLCNAASGGGATAAPGDAAAFLRQREAVLADLLSAASYRVSTSGTVQGDAQCLGDLVAADCAACLAQAVAQLRAVCGDALSADVYLAQCYARYWAPAHYFQAAITAEDSHDHGHTARNVAIVLGSLAGLLLVIILLSFVKRTC
ncbi:plasmodesmata-located protein 8-like isoform X2 [Curcuma longa]